MSFGLFIVMIYTKTIQKLIRSRLSYFDRCCYIFPDIWSRTRYFSPYINTEILRSIWDFCRSWNIAGCSKPTNTSKTKKTTLNALIYFLFLYSFISDNLHSKPHMRSLALYNPHTMFLKIHKIKQLFFKKLLWKVQFNSKSRTNSSYFNLLCL